MNKLQIFNGEWLKFNSFSGRDDYFSFLYEELYEYYIKIENSCNCNY
jgi:hypothetical protein